MKTKFNGILTLLLAFVVQLTFAQEQTVSGTVLDENSLPLPGATVLVKGTTNGASTDFDGKYSIKANNGDTLEFSYIGYATQAMEVTGASINVTLEPDNTLDEVVVVAYGTQREENVSSAIATVKAESIAQIPNASLDQILQGQSAGLNIQTSSGQPGASATVILRGRNSIAGVVEPLYVIDGVPVNEDNFRSLNSNDIQSVSILKDASASAIYGNRGAGGVIIVTTKKGTKGSGTQFTYRALHGVALNGDAGFDVMNASQYLNFQRDLGTGAGAGLTDAEIAAIAGYTNTDWQDVFFRNGRTNSHELNIRTGSENTTSYNSIGYFEQQGTTLRSDLQRFTFRSNIQTDLNKRLKFHSNLTANYSKSNLAEAPGSGSLDNPFIIPYIAQPHVSPYNPDGTLNITGTPYTTANGTNINGFLNTPFIALNTQTLNSELEEEVRIVGNVGGELEVVKNISIGADVGLDFIHETYKNITDPNSIRGDITPNADSEIKGSHFEGIQRDAKFNINSFIKYSNTFNEVHNFEVAAYTEFFKRHFNTFSFTGFGLDPKLLGSGSAITDGAVTEGPDDTNYYIPNVGSTQFEDALFSYFGVLRYNYDDKYNFQASLRRDASARFSDTNKWGTFWSVSGAWNMHKENFLAGNKTINSLKLRASYGSVGNGTVGIGAFQSFTTINAGSGYNNTASAYYTGVIGNPDLKWETTYQTNFGVDFSLLNYRLGGTIDVYNKRTEDLFIGQPLSPAVSGITTIDSNLAEVTNKGIELSLNYAIIEKDDFKWSVNVNAAYNKNEITDLGPTFDGSPILNGGGTALDVGQPIGAFYRVKWAGVNPANGLPLYYDVNGNVTENYSTADRVFSDRQQDPKYTGGFGTTIQYKNFSFNTLFAFAAEQYRLNGSLAIIEDTSLAGFANMSTTLLDAWQQPGDVTNIPVNNGTSFRSVAGDRYLEDASYLRLRNVSLSYSINKKVLERTKIVKGARIYVQGQNLLTWSKWRGFDPESNISSTFFEYPTPRTFSLGFDLEF